MRKEHRSQMPERDGYIPGVPCWIDTSQPDPEAAVDFYKGLFGWEFEDVMPPDSPGKYFIARIRGGDVAAVGSIPEAAPPLAMWNTYVWVESADDAAIIADACDIQKVMLTSLLIEPASTPEPVLLETMMPLRAHASMLVVAKGEEYVEAMLTALRA